MDSKALIKMLEKDGWTKRGCKGSHHVFTHPTKVRRHGDGAEGEGSHHVFTHPTKGGHISVPHPKSDLGKGITHKLLKQAGLQ